MKIAVVADIHSNVFALEAVLADIQTQGVDQIVNLGDIFFGPIAPRATYDLLSSVDILSISGNQDRQIHEAGQAEKAQNPSLEFIMDDLGEEPVAWLRTLPFDHHLDPDVYLCHGSPASDLEYLLESVLSGHPVPKTDEQIVQVLRGERAEMILCGHTHIVRSVSLSTGQIVVNPGSVGLPAYMDDEPILHVMESFSPHASYAILEKRAIGWTIDLKKIAYPVELAAQEALKQGWQDWAYALRTGRAFTG